MKIGFEMRNHVRVTAMTEHVLEERAKRDSIVRCSTSK